MQLRAYVIIGLILWEHLVYASNASIVVFTGEHIQRLSPYMTVLRDDQLTLSKNEILSGYQDHKFTMESDAHFLVLSGGNADSKPTYWLKVSIDNRLRKEPSFLRIDYATSPQIEAIYYRSHGNQSIIQLEFPKQRLRAKKHVEVPKGLGTLYIRVIPDDFSIPLIEIDLRSLSDTVYQNQDEIFLALSYGVCLALLIFNAVLFLRLKERSHFFYVLYSLFILLYYEGRYQLALEKFGFWEIPKSLLVPINTATSVFILLFLSNILELKRHMPITKRLYDCLIATGVAVIVYSFVDRTLTNLILMTLLVIGPLIIIVSTSMAIALRLPAARFLFVSILFLCLGNVIHFAGSLLGIENIWFLRNAQLMGFNTEMLLLSMAIGHKMRVEKDAMIADINHSHTELEKMIYPHQLELIKRGLPLNQTMPIGKSRATVIAFDIVRSSKIKMEHPRQFFAKVFARCYEVMMEDYDPHTSCAHSYRIKELGDGFLCSVGYPFRLADGLKRESIAVELAQRFMDIFEEELQKTDYAHPLHCAIGIASGPIESFYPESGTQVYDLFGRAIIQASRYEAMRNFIFDHTKIRDNILIIQDRVYEELPADRQRQFEALSLEDLNYRVRDDDRATILYYQFHQAAASEDLAVS